MTYTVNSENIQNMNTFVYYGKLQCMCAPPMQPYLLDILNVMHISLCMWRYGFLLRIEYPRLLPYVTKQLNKQLIAHAFILNCNMLHMSITYCINIQFQLMIKFYLCQYLALLQVESFVSVIISVSGLCSTVVEDSFCVTFKLWQSSENHILY